MTPADFQQPSSQPYFNYRTATNSVTARADRPAVEGTYLDGYGVVFTVTLPATGRDPRPGATGPKNARPQRLGLCQRRSTENGCRKKRPPEKHPPSATVC